MNSHLFMWREKLRKKNKQIESPHKKKSPNFYMRGKKSLHIKWNICLISPTSKFGIMDDKKEKKNLIYKLLEFRFSLCKGW